MTKDKVGPLKYEDGSTVTDNSVVTDILDTFFSSVFITEVIDNLPNLKQFFIGSLDDKLLDILMLPEVILKKLSNLKPDKAPGVDSVSPKLLEK